MSTALTTDQEVERRSFRLSGVSWKTYEKFLDIFERFPAHRLAYDRGEFDVLYWPAKRLSSARECIVLSGIDWKTYGDVLAIFEHFPEHRLAYDDGVLEIMSRSFPHERDSRFLSLLVVTLVEELGLDVVMGGATTFRIEEPPTGVDADECFWFGGSRDMAQRANVDLAIDPPPDLAIEVDVAHSSLNRIQVYE